MNRGRPLKGVNKLQKYSITLDPEKVKKIEEYSELNLSAFLQACVDQKLTEIELSNMKKKFALRSI